MAEIDDAISEVRLMVARQRRGPAVADISTAMGKVAGECRISRWAVWGLYHRRRKTISADQRMRVGSAYQRWCLHELRKLEAELLRQKMRWGNEPFQDLAAEAAALAERIRRRQGR